MPIFYNRHGKTQKKEVERKQKAFSDRNDITISNHTLVNQDNVKEGR